MNEVINGVEKIYSFNYTSTFSNFYGAGVPCDYIHGQAGNPKKKIVLGVDFLRHDLLLDSKVHGFTKYYQKLFNGTDYQFLRGEDRFSDENKNPADYENSEVYIWGHSLDESDKEYLQEIFSYNTSAHGASMKVVVLYHADWAREQQLYNLLHIIKKEKVEAWMKRGWLRFEHMPEIEIDFEKLAELRSLPAVVM